jgi:hypothetical protein
MPALSGGKKMTIRSMKTMKFYRADGCDQDINQALKPKNKQRTKTNRAVDKAFLPFQHTSYKISILLPKLNIRTIHIPKKKTTHALWPLKDSLDLRVHGVYCIQHNCGTVHIGQTNRSTEIRCKKHMRHLSLRQPDKSVVAGHIMDTWTTW